MTTIVDGSAGITYPNSTVQASAGVVLQVVNQTFTSSFTTTSTTYQNTGASLSITPKFSNSKILVTATPILFISENGQGLTYVYGAAAIYRNATTKLVEKGMSVNTGSTAIVDLSQTITFSYLDSPATTSSTTYNIFVASQATTFSTTFCWNGWSSQITLMEIAG